jgi:glycosyltransferase involved in cell wall biosynthesis
MRALIREFNLLNQDLYLQSVNGYAECCPIIKDNVREIENPDIDFAYTLPRNFETRFRSKAKIKLALYNYESTLLPNEWKQVHKFADFILPSSTFSKQVFVDNGWPEEKCIVVPHGINPLDFLDKTKYTKLSTTKTFKFLNISIPHHRKNLSLLLDAYYSEFNEEDDVVLILKTSLDKPKYIFECNVLEEIRNSQLKFRGKKLPQIEIVQERLDSIIPLLNTCQVLVSASASEGFGLPLLEGLAAGNLVIAPRASGQLDFLSDNNSLLVDSSLVSAEPKYQYWRPTPGAKIFRPNAQHLAEQMRKAYANYSDIVKSFNQDMKNISEQFTWNRAAKMILDIKK